jgi:hypothetical protein
MGVDAWGVSTGGVSTCCIAWADITITSWLENESICNQHVSAHSTAGSMAAINLDDWLQAEEEALQIPIYRVARLMRCRQLTENAAMLPAAT